MSYHGALSLGVSVSASAEADLSKKLSDDLDRRIKEGDYSIDKKQFEQYAEGAGEIAGTAVCTAYGAGAAAPLCASVAGAITKFLAGTVWGAFDDWFGNDDAEREARRKQIELQNQMNRVAAARLYLQAYLATQHAQNTLTKLASDLRLTKLKWEWSPSKTALLPAHPSGSQYLTVPGGGLLTPDDLLAQLRINGLPKGSGPAGTPDWVKMLDDGYYTLKTIAQDSDQYLTKLEKASVKTASQLVGAAAAREAFKYKQEQKRVVAEQEQKRAADAKTLAEQRAAADAKKKAAIFWVVGLGVAWGGTWWWLRKKKGR